MKALFLLTDGCPNVVPEQGHVPALRAYKDEHIESAGSIVISTFGFGYSLDSGLLKDIASEGQGM
jgi:hypothetical protein